MAKINKGTVNLDDLLLNAAEEIMKQIFREAGTKAIYDFLENNSHLKLEEIAEKPEVFSAGLERLLGSAGPVIEKLILKNLYSPLGLKFEGEERLRVFRLRKGVEEKCSCQSMR